MFFKLRLWIGISLILFFALVLSACSPTGQDISTPVSNQEQVTPTSAPATAAVEKTPEVAQALQEYSNQIFGFSLAYPDGYEVENSVYHTIVFLAPAGSPGHRERAILTVELALNQTAEWYANQMKAENANLGTDITASTLVIDGQQAYILGRLPGQDLNRQVFIVYKGILYHLTFMPDAPQAGDAYQQMETLYDAIINSLRFMPSRLEVPPVMSMNNMINQLERAFEARSADDMTRPLGDDLFLGYWTPNTPEGVTFARLGRNEATPFLLKTYLPQTPELTMEDQVDWASLVGSPDPFSAFFPNEVITPVLVHGWGLQGSDEAVIIIARYSDGSLYWRGLFVSQGPFVR